MRHRPAANRTAPRSNPPSVPFYPEKRPDNGKPPMKGSPYGALRRVSAAPLPAWYPGYFPAGSLPRAETGDRIWRYGISLLNPPPAPLSGMPFPWNPPKKGHSQLRAPASPPPQSAPAAADPDVHPALWFLYPQPAIRRLSACPDTASLLPAIEPL